MKTNVKFFKRMYSKDDPIIVKVFLSTLAAMIVSELATSIATMTDGIILARSLGEYAIASHGLATTYEQFIKVLIFFFSNGTQVACSQAVARLNLNRANRIFTVSTTMLIIVSCTIAAICFIFAEPFAILLGAGKDAAHLLRNTADYIRGLSLALPFMLLTSFLTPIMALNGDKKRIALAINTMMIVNIAGDLLNVTVFHGGMFGMALATAISYVCSFIILILHFRNTKGVNFCTGGLKLKEMRPVAKNGWMPSAMRMFSTVRQYILNLLFVNMASTAALAANSLVQGNIKVLFISISMAVGSTTLVVASFLYAEKDRRGMKQMYRTLCRFCVDPCILITALIFIFAPGICSIFGAGEFITLTAKELRMYVCSFSIINLKMFYSMYFQATNHTKLALYTSITGECVYLVLLAFILGKLFGETGLFLAFPIAELVCVSALFIILTVRLKRLPKSVDDLLFLDEDFGDDELPVLDQSITSVDEIVRLSEQSRQFCISNGIDGKKSMYLALCVEEAGALIFESEREDTKTHFIDLKISVQKNGDIIVRLRNDITPLNPEEFSSMLSDSDPAHHLGIRIIKNMAKDIQRTNVLNMNEMVITI